MATKPVPTFADSAPEWFRADLRSMARALRPYLTIVDGVRYVTPDAPDYLAAPYSRCIAHGYAQGWFA